VHSAAHKALIPTLDEVRRTANGGAWKKAAISTGEMNLFFDSLRANWPHFIRLEWKDGKLLPHLAGWKMSGKPVKYTLRGNQLDMTLEVLFAEHPTRQGVLPGGKGTYNIRMNRSGEKWTGIYEGVYEGKSIKGKLYAFYFPGQNNQ
jgi:hypothetical protein